MKKKCILALGLAFAMAMPMAAVAAVTDAQLGQEVTYTYICQNGAAGQQIFNDPVTCVAMVSTDTVENLWEDINSLPARIRLAEQAKYYEFKSGLTAEYEDIAFTQEHPDAMGSALQDYRLYGADNYWFEIDGQRVPIESLGQPIFSVTINGVTYDKCQYYGGSRHAIIRVPKAASSVTLNYIPCDSMLSFDEKGWTVRTYVPHNDELYRFHLKTGATPVDTASAQPQTTRTWVSDASGWRVQNTDGSYLTNEWYQSNGLWYYMGADGYMLTNTTTPDGYPVNADGVWVQ